MYLFKIRSFKPNTIKQIRIYQFTPLLKNYLFCADGAYLVLYFIQVVEEPYTMREARIHVRHVRDLLKSVEPSDAYNGVDCASLSFLNTVTAVGAILNI